MKSLAYWTRKLHRWGAVLTFLPLLLVIGSGLLLQVKKEFSWVQPPTQKGSSPNAAPETSWARILEVARGQADAEISDWSDIERLDVRPGKGVVKVRGNNHWELQIDLATGELLQSTYRRTDIIESLHDGTFFGDLAKLWLFLPNGLILLALWATGIYLWILPWWVKRRRA